MPAKEAQQKYCRPGGGMRQDGITKPATEIKFLMSQNPQAEHYGDMATASP